MSEEKSSFSRILQVALGVVLGFVLLFLVVWGVGFGIKKYEDYQSAMKTDRIYNLLSDAAKQQTKFPKAYVKWMSQGNHCGRWGDAMDENATEKNCACLISKRVEKFTMEEFMAASEAKWDDSKVHDAVVKERKIREECLQLTGNQ